MRNDLNNAIQRRFSVDFEPHRPSTTILSNCNPPVNSYLEDIGQRWRLPLIRRALASDNNASMSARATQGARPKSGRIYAFINRGRRHWTFYSYKALTTKKRRLNIFNYLFRTFPGAISHFIAAAAACKKPSY